MVIVAWTLGTFGDQLPKGDSRATGLFIHVSVGLLILVALIMRLAWRMAVPPPLPGSNEFGRWLGAFAHPAARLAHYILYALLSPFRSPGSSRSLRVATHCHCSD